MSAAGAPNLELVSHAVAGRRVLVAEDSPTTHEILKLLLTQRGHHVDIATDGEQALEALRLNRYDVALLDFHLPKMNGLRVASTVRSELHEQKDISRPQQKSSEVLSRQVVGRRVGGPQRHHL